MSSMGAGGGVVNIVQPIHMAMIETAKTRRKIGMAIAHHARLAGQAGKIAEIGFAKNAAI